jgi:serine O-acetyltransferase
LITFTSYSAKLRCTLRPNCFGPGLSLAHVGTLVVNNHAQIGENCRIHHRVFIGTNAGYPDQVPKLGNNVYIAPGVKMLGQIEIADGVAIGSNSVVNKSILEPNST